MLEMIMITKLRRHGERQNQQQQQQQQQQDRTTGVLKYSKLYHTPRVLYQVKRRLFWSFHLLEQQQQQQQQRNHCFINNNTKCQ